MTPSTVSDQQLATAQIALRPRFLSAGVEPNDLDRTLAEIGTWSVWRHAWSDAGRDWERVARAAGERRDTETAEDAHLRAALAHHFAGYLWFHEPAEYAATAAVSASCYLRAVDLRRNAVRVSFSSLGAHFTGVLRWPGDQPTIGLVILIPGLDATIVELHSLSAVFLARGLATLAFNGPAQGVMRETTVPEPAFHVVVGAALDELERQSAVLPVPTDRVATVGVSLGGYYAVEAAGHEPRVAVAVSVCGPFDFSDCLSSMPPLSRLAWSHACRMDNARDALEVARRFTLDACVARVDCEVLVVHAMGDEVIPCSEGKRLAARLRRAELVLSSEGDHVCHNIASRVRPLIADWVRTRLAGEAIRKERSSRPRLP